MRRSGTSPRADALTSAPPTVPWVGRFFVRLPCRAARRSVLLAVAAGRAGEIPGCLAEARGHFARSPRRAGIGRRAQSVRLAERAKCPGASCSDAGISPVRRGGRVSGGVRSRCGWPSGRNAQVRRARTRAFRPFVAAGGCRAASAVGAAGRAGENPGVGHGGTLAFRPLDARGSTRGARGAAGADCAGAAGARGATDWRPGAGLVDRYRASRACVGACAIAGRAAHLRRVVANCCRAGATATVRAPSAHADDVS
ncbi:hypothetical protein EDF19_0449 [Curtobacterium sp. PhB115]|nr:hypothetical protein EDF19_0449 [Curtobacterium sp. PhB115]